MKVKVHIVELVMPQEGSVIVGVYADESQIPKEYKPKKIKKKYDDSYEISTHEIEIPDKDILIHLRSTK